MKPKILLLLLFLILTTTSAGQDTDSLKFRSLPPVEFLTALQNTEKAMLIDVREFFEYRKSRLEGAINIPSSGNLETAADSIDRYSGLFLYCHSGVRSKRVAKALSAKGFTNIYSLDGGIVAWRKEGMPVDKKRKGRRGEWEKGRRN